MYVFALCEFEYGYSGQFYQRNDEYGGTTFWSLQGVEINFEPPYGYFIVETDVTPNWI
jgi:hypothetical protein